MLFFYLKIQLETLKNLIIVHDFDHNIKNNANRKDYLNCYANMSRYSAATANILLAVQVLKTYQLGKHIPFLTWYTVWPNALTTQKTLVRLTPPCSGKCWKQSLKMFDSPISPGVTLGSDLQSWHHMLMQGEQMRHQRELWYSSLQGLETGNTMTCSSCSPIGPYLTKVFDLHTLLGVQ